METQTNKKEMKMLLKDVSKIIQSKFNEEFDVMEISEMTTFEIGAICLGPSKGYWLAVYCNGKCMALVSSKRVDRRVFKTLDTIKKSLDDVGIARFTVHGCK